MDKMKPMNMPYELLKTITDGFSEERELGRGGFGVVYKGVDKDGHEIAVKILHSFLQGVDNKEFVTEFNNLTKLNKHENIVPFVGFCDEAEQVPTVYNGGNVIAEVTHRALCFEYMHNGSLAKHLYEEHQGFGWQRRYQIIKGMCEGLKHLHTGLERPVYHLDLKPDNILLDKNMVPKIADFGLSRLIGEESTINTIHLVGTLGYCPPEFMHYQIISPKFDIFSLGVIIIKIICGIAGYSHFDDKKPGRFIKKVLQNWKERLGAIQGYASLEKDFQQVKKCLEIALKCIGKEKDKRPNIKYIIDELNQTEKNKNDTIEMMAQVESSKLSSPGMVTGIQQRRPSLSTLPRELPARFLEEITEDFSETRLLTKLTHGAVYEGTLPEGGKIAVQKLGDSSSIPSEKIFHTEITNLMALQHENLVKLIGFSHETTKEVVKHNRRYVIVDILKCYLYYEYLAKGSLDMYFPGNQSTIDWDTRFKIIKGVCQGLHFLHRDSGAGPLIHMSLQPSAIWLDDDWLPKIADFGLSRLMMDEQTRIDTINVIGKNGYMAPEYLYRGELSTMSDIYSLGALIIQVTTNGENEYSFGDNARKNWQTDDQIASNYPSLDAEGLQQVKACIEIGLQCLEIKPNNRPSIVDIIQRISVVERRKEHCTVANKNHQIRPISTELLEIYPVQLRFPFVQNKLISCSLQLTNTTDDSVAIRLVTKNRRIYMVRMPLCCVVPPRSTYNLIVTKAEQRKPLLGNADDILTLESFVVREGDFNLKSGNLAIEYDHFFEKAQAANTKKVYQLTSKVVSDPVEEVNWKQAQIEINSDNKFSQVLYVDVHPTEPWIMTCHQSGDIFIWDYLEQEIDAQFKIARKPVYSAKFIERQKWFVAGDGDGTLHVHNYFTDEQVKIIEDAHEGDITSLDVHPTGSFVLTSSEDHLIKLWDWSNGWGCFRIFQGHNSKVTQVIFDPSDSNSFVSVSWDQKIKIWSISSSECRVTLNNQPERLLCIHNYTRQYQRYMITGSVDGIAQVWDVETEKCVEKLTGHTNHISSVYHHPELPILLTGSYDGTVRLWNSTTYRLENIIGLNLGAVNSIGYIEGSKRIVVGCDQGMAIMDIDLL